MLSAFALEPALPSHCTPTTDFLLRFSSAFHTCIPSPLAFASNVLGTLSIIAWLFAQMPQIYKNWSISSTSGLSIFFLVEWCLGDISNLLGALFTHQATWQIAIGAYYVFVDLCLVGQWIWYERLQHGSVVRRIWPRSGDSEGGRSGGTMEQVIIEGMSLGPASTDLDEQTNAGIGPDKAKQAARPRIIFRQPTFDQGRNVEIEKPFSALSTTPSSTTIHRVTTSSSMPSPSPRTVLLIACLVAIAHASPLGNQSVSHAEVTAQPTTLENVGTVFSWLSTFLYLGSRLPQLLKNWRRKSTAGLSPHLFIAAFCGNLLYSSALLTNPSGWYDFGPYGGGGWAGPDGVDRRKWVIAALPFFLGAAGVLGLDASVGIQFLLYDEAKVLVVEEGEGSQSHWRRVSGWMRGWVPSFSERRGNGRNGLVERGDQCGEGYGTMQ
ncbi:hypothetical protein LTR08_000260 [Meristemomyces frigidus]|nr:hypothetical protein LTR08_000260 [Meristemomyces frigidus]